MAIKFNGTHVELPWTKWRWVLIAPNEILTPGGRVIDPSGLDLLLWKAAFYDRGVKHQEKLKELYPDPPDFVLPNHGKLLPAGSERGRSAVRLLQKALGEEVL